MKNVLLIVPSLGIGGQEKIAINTVMGLKDEYDVKMIIFQKKDVEYNYPCEVINLNLPAKNSSFSKAINQVRRIFKVAKIRRRMKADVVFSFGNTANITNAFSGLVAPGKTISAVHGFAEVKKGISMKAILRFSEDVICIAKSMQESLLKIFPKAKNTIVVENGYDIVQVLEKAKEKTDIVLPKHSIVSMGRLEKVKGFDRLIKAFAIAQKERTDLNLVIIGQGTLSEELHELAVNEGVENSVHFLGYQSNPYVYLTKADVYALTSRNEGFPNALIEALSCQLPVIAVDCQSGPREILSEQYTSLRTKGVVAEKYGVLVEEASSEDKIVEYLAQAILMLVNNDEIVQKYKAIGLERANQFNNDVYKRKVVSLIEK